MIIHTAKPVALFAWGTWGTIWLKSRSQTECCQTYSWFCHFAKGKEVNSYPCPLLRITFHPTWPGSQAWSPEELLRPAALKQWAQSNWALTKSLVHSSVWFAPQIKSCKTWSLFCVPLVVGREINLYACPQLNIASTPAIQDTYLEVWEILAAYFEAQIHLRGEADQ